MNKKTVVLLVLIAGVIAAGIIVNRRPKQTTTPVPGPAPILSADAYPLYTNAAWGPVTAATEEGIAGYEATSTPATNVSDMASLAAPFDAYYKNKLLALGWTEDLALDAGGPGSEDTGYEKGSGRIIVGHSTDFLGTEPNSPVQCPCTVTFKIFSGTVSAN